MSGRLSRMKTDPQAESFQLIIGMIILLRAARAYPD
jgi:hypothetical protein